MNNSYMRIQAERRASVSRASASAARAIARPPLELPPWGYGSGRPVIPTTPATIINGSRRLTRARTRSVSPGKQTPNSCCQAGHAESAATFAVNARQSHQGHDGAEPAVIVDRNSADSAAEKHSSNEIKGTTAIATGANVTTQHAYSLRGANDSIGDTVVTGGNPAVTSSSMETWTSYDGGASTSPCLQSTLSSPHSATAELTNAPLTPTDSPTSWLRRLSPTILTSGAPPGMTSAADLADRNTDATRVPNAPSSLSPDVSGSPTSTTPIKESITNQPLTLVSPDAVSNPPCSSAGRSHEHKIVSPPASREVAVNVPVSRDSGNNTEGDVLHLNQDKTAAATPKANDQDKSNLIVGLVKVRSRHKGLMVDCPILETVFQNEVTASPTRAIRQSSSHKVVHIKAVVPRWAWNERGQFSPDSSSSALAPSSSDRRRVDKRKSLVSVNTQTSDTLLPAHRVTSEQRSTQPSPSSPITNKHVSALQDDCHLTPSPKLSACSVGSKSNHRTSNECRLNIWSLLAEGRANTNCQSSAHAQIKSLIPNETSNPPTSLLFHGSKPTMPENKGSEFLEKHSAPIDCESVIEDLAESLKLELPMSSSANDSDTETSAAHHKTAAKRFKRWPSLSSDDTECDRLPSASCQALPTINWSCAATNATASSDAIEHFKTSSYVEEMAVRDEPSSPHQRPTTGDRSPYTRPSKCRSPTANVDNRRPRADDASGRQSNQNSSRKNNAKTRPTPDDCSRPKRSPCLWRSATYDDETGSDFTCQEAHQHEHQHRRESQQQILSATEYASKSESSLSEHPKSIFYDCYDVTTTMTSSARSPCTRTQSSTLPPHQWVAVSDRDATEPLHANTHYSYPTRQRTNDMRSKPAGDVESTARKSRHSHHRPTSANRRHATEPKSASQHHHKRSTSGSQSTGSMALARNARVPAAGTNRHHSSTAGRYVSGHAGTESRRHARDVSSSTRRQHCSMADTRRRSHVHDEQHSTSDMASRRSAREATSAGRHQRIHVVSRSAGGQSRHRGRPPFVAANCSTSVAEQSNSTQPKHADSRQPRRRREPQNECRQPIIYCSPRSLKPFPPPISDRYPPPSFHNSAAADAGESLDGESVQYAFVQRPGDTDYCDDKPDDQNDHPLSNTPPPPRQERLAHSARTCADKLGDQRRNNAVDVRGVGRRRRHKKLPATPVVDGNGCWGAEQDASVRMAVPSVIERPAWKRY